MTVIYLFIYLIQIKCCLVKRLLAADLGCPIVYLFNKFLYLLLYNTLYIIVHIYLNNLSKNNFIIIKPQRN